MAGTLSREALVLDREAYADVRPALRARMIPLRAQRRVPLGDAFALAFENAETLQYQVQEMLMVEGVTDEAAVAYELHAYSRLLPTTHSLVATLFFEHDDVTTVKDELLRLTGAQHAVRLEVGGDPVQGAPPLSVAPGVEVPGPDEDGPSEVTHAVHFLRFTLDDAARDALRDPEIPLLAVIDHPEYRASTSIDGATRHALLSDLADGLLSDLADGD